MTKQTRKEQMKAGIKGSILLFGVVLIIGISVYYIGVYVPESVRGEADILCSNEGKASSWKIEKSWGGFSDNEYWYKVYCNIGNSCDGWLFGDHRCLRQDFIIKKESDFFGLK